VFATDTATAYVYCDDEQAVVCLSLGRDSYGLSGIVAALGKPYITLHNEALIHAVKEVDGRG
jgi:hypothetical protein